MIRSRFFTAVVVLSCSTFAQQPSSEAIGVPDSTQPRQSSAAAVDSVAVTKIENRGQSAASGGLSKEEHLAQYDNFAAMARHGRGLRTGGAILIASSALWIVGGAMIAASAPEQTTTTNNGYYYETTTTQDGSQMVLGVMIGAVGGAASIIAGIAMVVTGHIKQHIGESNKNNYSIDFRPSPGGLSMVIDF